MDDEPRKRRFTWWGCWYSQAIKTIYLLCVTKSSEAHTIRLRIILHVVSIPIEVTLIQLSRHYYSIKSLLLDLTCHVSFKNLQKTHESINCPVCTTMIGVNMDVIKLTDASVVAQIKQKNAQSAAIFKFTRKLLSFFLTDYNFWISYCNDKFFEWINFTVLIARRLHKQIWNPVRLKQLHPFERLRGRKSKVRTQNQNDSTRSNQHVSTNYIPRRHVKVYSRCQENKDYSLRIQERVPPRQSRVFSCKEAHQVCWSNDSMFCKNIFWNKSAERHLKAFLQFFFLEVLKFIKHWSCRHDKLLLSFMQQWVEYKEKLDGVQHKHRCKEQLQAIIQNRDISLTLNRRTGEGSYGISGPYNTL